MLIESEELLMWPISHEGECGLYLYIDVYIGVYNKTRGIFLGSFRSNLYVRK